MPDWLLALFSIVGVSFGLMNFVYAKRKLAEIAAKRISARPDLIEARLAVIVPAVKAAANSNIDPETDVPSTWDAELVQKMIDAGPTVLTEPNARNVDELLDGIADAYREQAALAFRARGEQHVLVN